MSGLRMCFQSVYVIKIQKNTMLIDYWITMTKIQTKQDVEGGNCRPDVTPVGNDTLGKVTGHLCLSVGHPCETIPTEGQGCKRGLFDENFHLRLQKLSWNPHLSASSSYLPLCTSLFQAIPPPSHPPDHGYVRHQTPKGFVHEPFYPLTPFTRKLARSWDFLQIRHGNAHL